MTIRSSSTMSWSRLLKAWCVPLCPACTCGHKGSGSSTGPGLQIWWQPGLTQVNSVAAHRDALCKQALALRPPLRDAPVGADDAMPWEATVGGRKNTPDEAGRAGVDVAIGADEPGGDRARPAEDARGARLEAVLVRLNRAAWTGPATSSAHR
jgi:hypothetical protein